MWLTALWEHDLQVSQWAIVVGASLGAAICDVRTRRIPNLLTGPLLLGGLVWAFCVSGPEGLADAAVGCLLLATPYFLLFLCGGGAGDAKLMGAIGAWLGTVNGLVALAAVSIAGILLAIGHALAKKRARSLLLNVSRAVRWAALALLARQKLGDAAYGLPDQHQAQKMPYGVAIFLGVCVGAGGTLLWRTITTG